MLIKIVLGFIFIALIETLNGIFRVKFLSKKLGVKKAKIVSFVFGSFLILLLNLLLVPWIAPCNIIEAIFIGISWASLMIFYDIFVGRVLFKLSWRKILEDFNIFKGNLLGVGMFIVIVLPPMLYIADISQI